MRFTVKAKLASAFGVVILLSAIAGGVAYMKLSDMVATAEGLVASAGRMEKAGELEKGILLQVRAEKSMIASTSDTEVEQFAAELARIRTSVAKSKDEIYASAAEAGRKLIDRFAAASSNMNAVEDQTIKVAKLDKAKATEHSVTEGRKASDEALNAANDYVALVKKAMADRAEQARQDGGQAQMMLLALVAVSLAIAVSAAFWIALNVS